MSVFINYFFFELVKLYNTAVITSIVRYDIICIPILLSDIKNIMLLKILNRK
jgi:hypothetical protein